MGNIKLNQLTKVYEGHVRAVDSIDIDVQDGEFFSLLGPSGCGKTTTLRMIAGFEPPTDGRVDIAQTDVTDDPPEDRPTNMVFQNLALFTHMDVHDNVAYGLKRSGVPEEERDERVAEALQLVDMGGYQDRHVTELSGGQQQRVALARALTNRSDVILLDEPLASLDRKLRQQMQLELRKIHEEVGMTFFYVTHDQEAAMTMSDRMAVMNEGHIEQVGPPTEVYDDPESAFVADFIGDVNVFDGTVEGGRFRAADGREFETPSAEADSAGGDATLVVRPERLHIGENLDMANTVDGTVDDAVFRGSNIRYEVDDGNRSLNVDEQNLERRRPFSRGDDVTVGWRRDAALIYYD